MPRVAEPIEDEAGALHPADLRAAQVAAYFEALPTVLVGNLIAIAMVVVSIGGRIDRTTDVVWSVASLVILGVRALLIRRFRRSDGQDELARWAGAAVGGSFATGLMWGLCAFLFYVPQEIELQAVLVLTLAVLNTGGAGVLSTFPPAYFASLVPCLPMLSIRLLLDGGTFQDTMAVATAVLSAFLALQGVNIGRVYANSFTLRLRNQRFAERLASQAEDMRQALAQADEANRAKSDFLSTISHELRTPIHTTIGAIRLLSDTTLDRMQQRCVDIIAVAGRTLLLTINDILDFAGVDASQPESGPSRFRPRQIVEDAVALMMPEATAKQLDLVAMLDGALPEVLVGDEGRLQQILLNLIGNAVKFTERGGIVVRGGVRRGGNGSENGHVLRLEIVDTGIGLDEDQQQVVFEPFVQADPSIRRRFGGTGLGLAICRRLARLSGGDVGVVSRAGEGSCFWVGLPVTVDAFPVVEPPPQLASVAGKRLLVVDDEPANRFLLGELLRARGAVVVEAAGGEGALDILDRITVDAVLMDMRMPDLDGLETTRRLRRQGRATRSVPVLGVTANARPEDIAACHEAGMDGVVVKPVVIEKLLQALLPLLGGPALLQDQLRNRTPVPVPVAAEPPSALGQLIDDLGPEIAERLLLTARTSLAQSGAALEAVLSASEAAPIAAAAHKLAGLAASARLEALRSLAERLEVAAREGQRDALTRLAAELPETVADADAQLVRALDLIGADAD
jgi:signal transduction histidine kinase/DNA-binding NarL/FixJ family response regulator/HPt (histidine-containing phosphotransfer) domain-containing protein